MLASERRLNLRGCTGASMERALLEAAAPLALALFPEALALARALAATRLPLVLALIGPAAAFALRRGELGRTAQEAKEFGPLKAAGLLFWAVCVLFSPTAYPFWWHVCASLRFLAVTDIVNKLAVTAVPVVARSHENMVSSILSQPDKFKHAFVHEQLLVLLGGTGFATGLAAWCRHTMTQKSLEMETFEHVLLSIISGAFFVAFAVHSVRRYVMSWEVQTVCCFYESSIHTLKTLKKLQAPREELTNRPGHERSHSLGSVDLPTDDAGSPKSEESGPTSVFDFADTTEIYKGATAIRTLTEIAMGALVKPWLRPSRLMASSSFGSFGAGMSPQTASWLRDMFTGYEAPSSDDDSSEAYEIEPIPEVDEFDPSIRPDITAQGKRPSSSRSRTETAHTDVNDNGQGGPVSESKSQDDADGDNLDLTAPSEHDNAGRILIFTNKMQATFKAIKSGSAVTSLKPVTNGSQSETCSDGNGPLPPALKIVIADDNSSNFDTPRVHRRRMTLTSWGFDGLTATYDELAEHATNLLCSRALQPLQTDRATVFNFVSEVRSRYIAENPYHNFRHAVDVCHTCFKFLRLTHSIHFLESLDMAAMLVAGLIHDIGHPGVNNAFLIATNHDLALRYNDRSPLENMHLSTLFQDILPTPGANILANLSASKHKDIRRRIVLMVLATDMAFHFNQVSDMNVFANVNKDVLPYAPVLPDLSAGIKRDASVSVNLSSTRPSHNRNNSGSRRLSMPPRELSLNSATLAHERSEIGAKRRGSGGFSTTLPAEWLTGDRSRSSPRIDKASSRRSISPPPDLRSPTNSATRKRTPSNSDEKPMTTPRNSHSPPRHSRKPRSISDSLVPSCLRVSENRQMLLNVMLHAADISNPAKPFPIAGKWAIAVIEEFFQQGDKERERGLPVTPLMDRTSACEPRMQMDFIEFVVAPLYQTLLGVFPGFHELLKNLCDNHRYYCELRLQQLRGMEPSLVDIPSPSAGPHSQVPFQNHVPPPSPRSIFPSKEAEEEATALQMRTAKLATSCHPSIEQAIKLLNPQSSGAPTE